MNRFDTSNNGGMPLVLDDFRFLTAAINEALTGLMSDYGDNTAANSFIISGCLISGGSFSAGFICYKGEVVKCDGGTVPTPPVGQINYWTVVETVDSAGDKSYQNLTTHSTYIKRRAVVTAGTTPMDFMPITNTRVLANGIYTSLDALGLFSHKIQPSWNTASLTSSWAHASGFGAVPRYHLDEFGVVRLSGACKSGSVGSGSTIFTLPTGFRPASIVTVFAPVISEGTTTTQNLMRLNILTTGRVVPDQLVFASPAISDPMVFLDSVTFKIN